MRAIFRIVDVRYFSLAAMLRCLHLRARSLCLGPLASSEGCAVVLNDHGQGSEYGQVLCALHVAHILFLETTGVSGAIMICGEF